MANHGYVRSKRRITKEMVDQALDDVNNKFLFGKMQVEYSHCPEPGAWGLHVWQIQVEGQPQTGRVMWLKNNRSKTFEIRHGGGGDFIWWVDHLIRNAVCEITDGTITDDAGGERWNHKTYPSYPFREYKIRQCLNQGGTLSTIRFYTKMWKTGRFTPPPEHTKPKVSRT